MKTSLKHICCSILFVSIRGRQKPHIQSNKEESSPLVVFLTERVPALHPPEHRTRPHFLLDTFQRTDSCRSRTILGELDN
ncbi:hypothetical protein VN97_g9170 [Penicillium thymicola]|uniref:Uncharacterized protein n=1 Tax=Penicillium thymicola TaxID=293382 RepID=A0AAI9TBE8_PENTH|nr:hypothetical protein VN97_g9170 [Penicillium thymicola]